MKITIDGKEVLHLKRIQRKIIKDEIPAEIFRDNMTRRCRYWLERPQNHYANFNKETLISQLQQNGATNIPTNLLKLAEDHADLFPCRYGYADITNDIVCTVGPNSFLFSMSHRKIFRKIKEAEQEKQTRNSYLDYEKEELEKRIGWILQHKWKNCVKRLRFSWMPRLEERGIMNVPIDDELFAELVFSQHDYIESHKLN